MGLGFNVIPGVLFEFVSGSLGHSTDIVDSFKYISKSTRPYNGSISAISGFNWRSSLVWAMDVADPHQADDPELELIAP